MIIFPVASVLVRGGGKISLLSVLARDLERERQYSVYSHLVGDLDWKGEHFPLLSTLA